MLQHISLGQYIPSDSLIHGLDPRIKIITVVAMVMGVFAASFPLQLMALLVFSSVLIYMSGISGKYYLQALKPFIPIMVITLVAQMLFVGGREIFALGIIRITYEGLWAAAALGVRLVIILVMARLLTATTTPVAMTDGLEKMIKPLARIGFPTHELVMIMTISLDLFPFC
jgi:energy-coupling factor transport system permease protein